MKKFTFDINIEAWIRYIEIEAENYDEALEELYSMSLSELAEEGNVKDTEITDVDCEVEDN